jgi:hypothetical protein
MGLSQYVDEPTLEKLERLLPGVELEPILKPLSLSKYPSVSIELPTAPQADYRFVLHLQPEKQVSARLPQSDATHYYFWYQPFEDAAFRNSAEKLDNAFIETVEKLVRHETRIRQKRGLLNHSFRCEYKSPKGWERVYGHSALRLGGFKVPPIAGREQVYRSAALAPLPTLPHNHE